MISNCVAEVVFGANFQAKLLRLNITVRARHQHCREYLLSSCLVVLKGDDHMELFILGLITHPFI